MYLDTYVSQVFRYSFVFDYIALDGLNPFFYLLLLLSYARVFKHGI